MKSSASIGDLGALFSSDGGSSTQGLMGADKIRNPSRLIAIQVVEAWDIPWDCVADEDHSFKPVRAWISCDNGKPSMTAMVNSKQPVWNETFTIVDPDAKKLEVALKDIDPDGTIDEIGRKVVRFNLQRARYISISRRVVLRPSKKVKLFQKMQVVPSQSKIRIIAEPAKSVSFSFKVLELGSFQHPFYSAVNFEGGEKVKFACQIEVGGVEITSAKVTFSGKDVEFNERLQIPCCGIGSHSRVKISLIDAKTSVKLCSALLPLPEVFEQDGVLNVSGRVTLPGQVNFSSLQFIDKVEQVNLKDATGAGGRSMMKGPKSVGSLGLAITCKAVPPTNLQGILGTPPSLGDKYRLLFNSFFGIPNDVDQWNSVQDKSRGLFVLKMF